MRVLISDARPSVRNALQLLCQQSNHLVVGTASTQQDLVEKSKSLCPELIFLDWELSGKFGYGILSELFKTLAYRPIVVTLSINPDSRFAALMAGSSAFVSKVDPPEQILRVLEALAQDEK